MLRMVAYGVWLSFNEIWNLVFEEASLWRVCSTQTETSLLKFVTSQSRSIRPRRQEEFWFEGHGAVECFSEISISLTNNSAILAFLIWEVDASSAKMQEQNTKDPRPIWSKSGLGLRRTNGSSVQFLAHSRNILCKSLSLEMARSFESVESGKSCHSSLDINMNSISLSLAPASADQSCSSDAGKTHPQRRRVGLDKDSPSLISHSFFAVAWYYETIPILMITSAEFSLLFNESFLDLFFSRWKTDLWNSRCPSPRQKTAERSKRIPTLGIKPVAANSSPFKIPVSTSKHCNSKRWLEISSYRFCLQTPHWLVSQWKTWENEVVFLHLRISRALKLPPVVEFSDIIRSKPITTQVNIHIDKSFTELDAGTYPKPPWSMVMQDLSWWIDLSSVSWCFMILVFGTEFHRRLYHVAAELHLLTNACQLQNPLQAQGPLLIPRPVRSEIFHNRTCWQQTPFTLETLDTHLLHCKLQRKTLVIKNTNSLLCQLPVSNFVLPEPFTILQAVLHHQSFTPEIY